MEEWQKDCESNQKIGDIFKKLGPFLILYTEYIKDYKKGLHLINDLNTRNNKFRAVMDEIQVRKYIFYYFELWLNNIFGASIIFYHVKNWFLETCYFPTLGTTWLWKINHDRSYDSDNSKDPSIWNAFQRLSKEAFGRLSR